MFDFVHRKKRVVQVILALITLPFAFFGVDYYFRNASSVTEIAKVGGDRITQAEFADTLRDQQDRMRQQLGANFDPALFDSPEVRYSILDQIVSQRLLEGQARRDSFRVADAQLAQFIGALPAFQEEGKFSRARYEQLLASQNLTPLMFEQRLRQELTLAPLQEPLANANIVARSNVERYLSLAEQQRIASSVSIAPDAYLKEVKIDDAAIKAFYDGNQAAFQTPEEVKIEYVSLSPDAVSGQLAVDPAEVRKAYDDNLKLYSKPEQRQASHILVAVKPDASEEQKAAARKKAEDIAAQARKNPAQFADLAKKNSDDPGSAGQGGDLGAFARDGSMVKPFEDAVFSAKQGDIVGPVQTDFGWHVIKVTSIQPGKTLSFDEARPAIEQDLKRQKSSRKFVETAEQFQNLVYEQSESLQPAAKALNLQVQTTPFLSRAQVQSLGRNNAKFVQAVFSPDSLQSKRNTEAIEVAQNTLMAARVIEHKPAAPRPFDEVKTEIRRQLERSAASELAQKAGKERLAMLEQGKDAGLSFGKPVTLTRNQPQPGFPPDALVKIFQASAAKLPTYLGLPGEQGAFSIYRVEKVVPPSAPDADKLTAMTARFADQVGRELVTSYIASLRSKADVRINQANLEKK
jgi:peptidyl-prolyl cis-trans isomerase D